MAAVTDLLPVVRDFDDYGEVHSVAETWAPALDVICERHGLPAAEFHHSAVGSHVIHLCPGKVAIKLYAPVFPEDFGTERLVLPLADKHIDLDTPRILGEGEIEGWPYYILSWVGGIPLEDIWPELSRSEKNSISAEIGELIAAWHEMPQDGLAPLKINWDGFVQDQIDDFVVTGQDKGAPDEWLAVLQMYIRDRAPLLAENRAVLLNADFTGEHLVVAERNGALHLTGLLDFADAMIGAPTYDFVAPGIDVMAGDGESQRALLKGYGLAADADGMLRHRLMLWTLLHRFADVNQLLSLAGRPRTDDGTMGLMDRLWPL